MEFETDDVRLPIYIMIKDKEIKKNEKNLLSMIKDMIQTAELELAEISPT